MKRRLMLTLVASALAVLFAASASAEAGPIVRPKSECPSGFSRVSSTLHPEVDRNRDTFICENAIIGILIDNHVVPVRVKP